MDLCDGGHVGGMWGLVDLCDGNHVGVYGIYVNRGVWECVNV